MLAAGSENPSALATNLGNNGNLLHTPSGGYVAARMLQFAGFTFRKFASAYVTPWPAQHPHALAMLFLAIRACHHFLLTCLENILTFHVLLRKKPPRQPLHNRLHNRVARLHITIHRHRLGP